MNKFVKAGIAVLGVIVGASVLTTVGIAAYVINHPERYNPIPRSASAVDEQVRIAQLNAPTVRTKDTTGLALKTSREWAHPTVYFTITNNGSAPIKGFDVLCLPFGADAKLTFTPRSTGMIRETVLPKATTKASLNIGINVYKELLETVTLHCSISEVER
jgi:hypothetical protein